MKNNIDSKSVVPMPLFQQVKDSIRTKIMEGIYAPHQKLPSERQMTESFSVSRITVRQALGELQSEGLIFKINGKGTFVSQPKARFDVSKLRGFGESAASLGQEAFSKLISISTLESAKEICQKLCLPDSHQITKIQRLRYLNREPLAFDITYAASHLGARIASADLQRRDIFNILENDLGIVISSAEVNVEAIVSDEKLSTHLNIEQNSAVLHIERTILDQSKKPILYENIYYRGDFFKYGLNIDRAHLTR